MANKLTVKRCLVLIWAPLSWIAKQITGNAIYDAATSSIGSWLNISKADVFATIASWTVPAIGTAGVLIAVYMYLERKLRNEIQMGANVVMPIGDRHERIGIDLEGGTTRLRQTKIRNHDIGIRNKDGNLDAENIDIR